MEKCVMVNGAPFKGVIHVGAHLGEETEAYVNANIKNVVWFEANKKLMKHLFDKTNFYPIKNYYKNVALSDVDDEEITFNIANNGQSSSMLELGVHAQQYPHIQYTDHISMKTKRFDSIKDIVISDYDFLNLDVQGAELKVLRGFGRLLENFSAVYTEINFVEMYKNCCLVEEIDKHLDGFGFKRVITEAPEQTWGDALYIKK